MLDLTHETNFRYDYFKKSKIWMTNYRKIWGKIYRLRATATVIGWPKLWALTRSMLAQKMLLIQGVTAKSAKIIFTVTLCSSRYWKKPMGLTWSDKRGRALNQSHHIYFRMTQQKFIDRIDGRGFWASKFGRPSKYLNSKSRSASSNTRMIRRDPQTVKVTKIYHGSQCPFQEWSTS